MSPIPEQSRSKTLNQPPYKSDVVARQVIPVPHCLCFSLIFIIINMGRNGKNKKSVTEGYITCSDSDEDEDIKKLKSRDA